MIDNPETHANTLRTWATPFLLLLGSAIVVFGVSFLIDINRAQDGRGAASLLLDPNPDAALGTLSSAGEVVAAVLAIAITVVAIIVELAANRYTHRVTELFVSEPINFAVMGFFVVTAIQALAVSMVFDLDGLSGAVFVPHIGVMVSMGMLGLSLLILLPYFGFVFAFLSPLNILDRIRKHAIDQVNSAHRNIDRAQGESVRSVEQITDVVMNAMEHNDKAVSIGGVRALGRLLREYRALRDDLPKDWFRISEGLSQNPDFISMAPSVLEDLGARGRWFEMKIMRQFQTIYASALGRMRDVAYVVAIETRAAAVGALDDEDQETVDLSIMFFNTYMRATLNSRDVRTAYNVLHQYRLLAEHALEKGAWQRTVEIGRYFQYYGLTANNMGLAFVLETAAYDLCALCESCFDKDSPALRQLLRTFLEVDKEGETESHEKALRGVRKAQIKLATYFLMRGDDKKARRVYEDMAHEKHERMISLRDELLAVRSPQFWEVSDRGENFDYLSPERKEEMMRFFEWFGGLMPPRASLIAPPSSNLEPSDSEPAGNSTHHED